VRAGDVARSPEVLVFPGLGKWLRRGAWTRTLQPPRPAARTSNSAEESPSFCSEDHTTDLRLMSQNLPFSKQQAFGQTWDPNQRSTIARTSTEWL